MPLPPIPETPDELTPAWLGEALGGARVANARWEGVGADYGFAGIAVRVHLAYDASDSAAPATLVAKLAPADADAREARFYRELGAPSLAPACFYADARDGRSVLLLEDVRGHQGDVLAGCSVEEAALALERLAPFHARWWGERADAAGLPRAFRDSRARQERYAAQAEAFLAREGERLPPGIRELVSRLGGRLAAAVERLRAGPRTVVHGDFHLDNVLFASEGRVVALDWERVAVGPPAWDVALFLFGSLTVEDRRTAASAVLDRYAALLAEHGVRDYPGPDLGRDCDLALLLLLAGGVGWLAAPERPEASARERAVRRATLADGRLVAALLERDVAAALDRVGA